MPVHKSPQSATSSQSEEVNTEATPSQQIVYYWIPEASQMMDTKLEGAVKCGNKRLFVMRHGERIDFSFGKSWVNACFDDKGNYTRKDINMPVTMVKRDSHLDFLKDSPLTEIGCFQARKTGEALKIAGVDIQHVYVSPSLRCVQTAQGVIDGMGKKTSLSMGIEPVAFEWLGWYKNALPVWIPPKKLADEGFSVNVQHRQLANLADVNKDENVPQYYARCHRLIQRILEKHKNDEGDILVVAHAGSLDTFTRQLVDKPPRDSKEMHTMLASFSYCCLCCCMEERPGVWRLKAPPIPPLQGFDWRVMMGI